MRIRVDLNAVQKLLFDDLIKKIRAIGEQKGSYKARQEKNKEIYFDIISILLTLKQDAMSGNFAQMIKANLGPDHQFVFFDEDEKVFKKEKLKKIDVTWGEDVPLSEEEMNEINIQLKANEFLEDGGRNPLRNTFTVDLGIFDDQLKEEERMRKATNKTLESDILPKSTILTPSKDDYEDLSIEMLAKGWA